MIQLVQAACLLGLSATPALAQSWSAKFTWRQLTDGVYAIEANSMGSNSMVVVGDSAVLLVDAQIAPSSANLLLDELEAITSLPVSHLVNTHWHIDHTGGNEAIRQRNLELQIIAHRFATDGALKGGEKQRRLAIEFWREALGENLQTVDSLSLAELETPFFFEPNVLVNHPMRIDLGGRIVEVLPLPGGHTGGDIVVYLPAERILAAGDLVLPQLFASNGYPGRYVRSLRALKDLAPITIVPGHGPVQQGTELVSDQLEQLESLLSEVGEALRSEEEEGAIVLHLAPSAGHALGDPEGLIRATIREMTSDPTEEDSTDASTRFAEPGSELPARDMALVGVHLIPMDRDRVLEGYSVLIRDGRIADIGPRAEVTIPEGVPQLSPPAGSVWYVMPGLADMHVHMFDEGEMWLYLANGVTTVRNMHGIERHLKWRSEIEAGDRTGPRILTAGPILDGDPPFRVTNTVVRTPEEARQEVRRQAGLGYDFIKIYDNISPEVYRALADEAKRQNMPMVGHLPTPVGLDGVLETGGQKAIEHCEELAPFFRDLTDSELKKKVRRLVDAGIWLGPTLTAWKWPIRQADSAVMASIPWDYLNPSTLESFQWATERVSMSDLERTRRQRGYDMCDAITREYHLAGGNLLAGSDSPLPALPPGYTLIEELEALEHLGLTPFDALLTSTRAAAEFAGRSNEFGMIKRGLSADLLVLTANPLETTSNVRERVGVVVLGVWFSEQDLRQRLDRLATTYGNVRDKR